jgi:phosphoenolpyruvate-protein phosphotransferase (PTS system enzyme I)
VLLYVPEKLLIPRRGCAREKVEEEVARLQQAIEASRQQLVAIRDRMAEEMGLVHAHIFEAHLLMLEDQMLVQETIRRIRENGDEAAWGLKQTLESVMERLGSIDDVWVRERVVDIHDVGSRILRNLVGKQRQDLSTLDKEVVIVAHDLAPSDTALMRKDKVVGIATEVGGRTSHTAIMARALEIPAIVGVDHVMQKVKTGDPVIVDGLSGLIVVDPTPEAFKEYLDRAQRYHYFESQLTRLKDVPAVTTDGYRIELAANIELISEVTALRDFGATSIGLYRTEFLYLNRPHLPTEEEHFEAYEAVARETAPRPAVIRTMDLGGDKFLSNFGLAANIHSSLGLRAIRLCLREPELFQTQLRGVLRASTHGNLKIMFPMISNLAEFRQAKSMVRRVMEELRAEGKPFDEEIEIGLMIEVPSAAIIADALAREADFFSVGTNDLIQYALAIDRVNEEVAYLYEPLHPAVLRMAKYIVEVGHREGIWVGICGEMAADPGAAILLVGLGFDELSMNPVAIPRVKKAIRAFSYKEAVDMAEQIVNYPTAEEARAFLESKLAEKFPDGLY